MPRPLPDFDSCIRKTDSCWFWTGVQGGGSDGNPYGYHSKRLAHHIAYERAYGSIPPEYIVHHTCVTPLCVNPAHLEAHHKDEHPDQISVINRNKERCVRDHAFTPENTYLTPNGRRQCRICRAAASKDHWERKRLAHL